MPRKKTAGHAPRKIRLRAREAGGDDADAGMKIAVVCGGVSHERDVSLSGGVEIARALRGQSHAVALLDLFLGWPESSDRGEEIFTREEAGISPVVGEKDPDLEAIRSLRPGQGLIGPRVLEICRQADIVFLALHGEEGENGKLQAYFDLHGVPYTGSGYLGSALAMDKSLSKTLLQAAGIPVPEGMVLQRGQAHGTIGWPCVVKPCSGGSSVGTTIVRSPEDYGRALELAFSYEERVLVERYIPGRELTVGILEGKAMPVTEIIPKSGFYDYKNKYQPGLTQETCPARLTSEQTAAVQTLAVRAFGVLHMQAYGRFDFILGKDGVYYCLEGNTLPGMTPTSLIPCMGRAMGMSYGQLCERLVEASLKKYRRAEPCGG